MINLSFNKITSNNIKPSDTSLKQNVSFKGNEVDTFVKSESASSEKSTVQLKSELETLKKQYEEALTAQREKSRIASQTLKEYRYARKEKPCAELYNKYTVARKEADIALREVSALKTKLVETRLLYFNALDTKKKTAFLYDDTITSAEKRKILSEQSDIIHMANFRYQLRSMTRSEIPDELFNKWEKDGYIKVDVLDKDDKYIDTTHPINAEFMENMKKSLPTSVCVGEFIAKFNYTQEDVSNEIKEGKIIPLCADTRGLSSNFMIDYENEINKQSISRNNKLKPFPSPKYYRSPSHAGKLLVPISYLKKLGFGTSDEIIQMVKNGKLQGIYAIKDTPEGKKKIPCININDNASAYNLKEARKQNPNTIQVSNFAKKYGISQRRMEEILLNGDMEIIPKYIFEFDYRTPFIDLNVEKNAQYLDKLIFEKEFETTLKQQKKEYQRTRVSARSRIAWYLSPNTREIATNEAQNRPWLGEIIEKKEESGEDSLERTEQQSLYSYYKEIWTQAGTEEFKEASKKANEILKKYDEQGIDSIEDEEIKKIITESQI